MRIRAHRQTTEQYIYKSDKTLDPSWNNLEDVELHIFTAWSVNILHVESVTEESGKYKISIPDDEALRVFNRPHPNLDGYTLRNFIYYTENAYELIDEDGEWYFDSSENKVYFKAPADLDPNQAETVIPNLETLVSIKGTLDTPVKNIAFTDMGLCIRIGRCRARTVLLTVRLCSTS